MRITLEQVVKELEKNGYPWAKGHFYSPVDNSSCAVGQIIRNLGYTENSFSVGWWLARLFSDITKKSLINYNDNEAESFLDVVAFAKKAIKGHEKEVITLPNV